MCQEGAKMGVDEETRIPPRSGPPPLRAYASGARSYTAVASRRLVMCQGEAKARELRYDPMGVDEETRIPPRSRPGEPLTDSEVVSGVGTDHGVDPNLAAMRTPTKAWGELLDEEHKPPEKISLPRGPGDTAIAAAAAAILTAGIFTSLGGPDLRMFRGVEPTKHTLAPATPTVEKKAATPQPAAKTSAAEKNVATSPGEKMSLDMPTPNDESFRSLADELDKL